MRMDRAFMVLAAALLAAGLVGGVTHAAPASAGSAFPPFGMEPGTRRGPEPSMLLTAPPAASTQAQADPPLLLALTALSPAHPTADRLAAIGRLTALAQHGNAFAEYVIGSLYMWGGQRPHALLPYDESLAREYLSNAAIRGELPAMEALAQLDLRTRHPLQAMIWAQTLVYYRHQLRPAQKRAAGYLPELIAHAQEQLTAAQEARLLSDVNGVLVRYGPRIEAALHATAPELPAACRARRIAPQGTVPDFFRPGRWKHVPRAASLVMIYAVDPAGRIVDHAIINVLPNWHVRYQMRYPLAIMRFNPAPGCHGLRSVIQPMHYIDHRYVMHWH